MDEDGACDLWTGGGLIEPIDLLILRAEGDLTASLSAHLQLLLDAEQCMVITVVSAGEWCRHTHRRRAGSSTVLMWGGSSRIGRAGVGRSVGARTS